MRGRRGIGKFDCMEGKREEIDDERTWCDKGGEKNVFILKIS